MQIIKYTNIQDITSKLMVNVLINNFLCSLQYLCLMQAIHNSYENIDVQPLITLNLYLYHIVPDVSHYEVMGAG